MSKRPSPVRSISFSALKLPLRSCWRTLAVAMLAASGLFTPGVILLLGKSAIAQTTSAPPGTIDNQAAGSFLDPTDSSTQVVESNIVQVTVLEVAGITVTASGSTDDGEVNPDDVISFDFTITNVGNDPTQFFIPGAPSAVSNGTAGTLQIVAYDPDGTGTEAASQAVTIDVPSTGISTGDTNALDLPNGAIPPGGTVTVRVPVTVDSGAIAGSVVSVTFGETTPDGGGSTQNQPYVAGTSDVYTQDNQDADAVDSSLTTATETEAAGVLAVSAEREASASQDSSAIAVSLGKDYGDAPDSGNGTGSFNYQTTAADNGPSHDINTNLYIGTVPDPDDGTLQEIPAEADDQADTQDEGDIVLNLLSTTDLSYTISDIPVTNDLAQQAYLVGWIDFDQSGSFDADEAATIAVSATGAQTVTLDWATLPSDIQSGTTYARFRLTTDSTVATGTASTSLAVGPASDGEVEDYGFGIAPSGPATNGFCYYSDRFEWSDYASGGLPVSIGGITINGSVINTSFANPNTSRGHGISTGTQGAETGNYNLNMGSPTVTTAGDYFDFRYTFAPSVTDLAFRLIDVDQADGGWQDIVTVTAFYQGNPVPVTLTPEGPNVSVPAAPGNRAIGIGPAASTQTLANVRVDVTGPVDTVDIRYEAGTSSGQFIWIGDFGLCSSDYSDNPASYGDARHTLSNISSLHLGTTAPDNDTAIVSLASAVADGDDNNGGDDEDAFITVDAVSAPGIYTLTVPTTNTTGGPVVLHGWIDFDQDGQFSSGEHQGVLVPDGATSAEMAWNIPAGTSSGSTFARFRITTDNLTDDAATVLDERAIGPANNGEVEDHPVEITAVSNDPNVLLVKRITAINNNPTENPNDNTPLNTVLNDDVTDSADDHPNWPTNFLVGALNGGSVRPVSNNPADTVEYSIYFLSTGAIDAEDVLVCDRIPPNTSFLPNAYASTPTDQLGISLDFNGNSNVLTITNDGDAGYYFPPGIEPTTQFPGVNCGDANDNGAVVVNLGNLPPATDPGTPANSYGVLRFQVRID